LRSLAPFAVILPLFLIAAHPRKSAVKRSVSDHGGPSAFVFLRVLCGLVFGFGFPITAIPRDVGDYGD
jgi:hypothetical protein